MSTLDGRELLVGVTGGIAAYKSAMLVSRLVQAGAGVRVVMTRSSTRLVGPKTFEALTGRPVLVDLFGPGAHPHIEPAEAAELMCVAPATANILAKAAHGLADDLLSTLLLSFHGPLLMAPAMNCHMWQKPAVQRNVAQLRADGVILIEPEEGYLSCGARGVGRMAEPETILLAIGQALERSGKATLQ
jgi:phosphopantothenoylcysteine decarboxylase